MVDAVRPGMAGDAVHGGHGLFGCPAVQHEVVQAGASGIPAVVFFQIHDGNGVFQRGRFRNGLRTVVNREPGPWIGRFVHFLLGGTHFSLSGRSAGWSFRQSKPEFLAKDGISGATELSAYLSGT